MLVKFIKNNKGQRIGCLVGKSNGIGWSQVHAKRDTFDRNKALDIAEGRCDRGYEIYLSSKHTGTAQTTDGSHIVNVPTAVIREFPAFINRCQRYFENAK